MRKTRILFTTTLGLLLIVVGLLSMIPTILAAPPQQDEDTTTEVGNERPPEPSSEYCLLCHSQEGREWTLPNGEILSLTVDREILSGSVHGEDNPEGALQCADCHLDHRFPHKPNPSRTRREFELERYASCRNCHIDQYLHLQDSMHGQKLREGHLEAATCVDCHGGHDIQPPNEPRQRISLTCGECHGVIFSTYRDSVHGAALLDENNPDVPTCIDCHGVHDISDPNASVFRIRSPKLCANCHADEELMSKYDISTDVFNSYLSEFHGSTVALFEQLDPEVNTNKAVCYDCHGVHNITPADSTKSQVVRENLLSTCQQCHPDATSDFPDSWVGHFTPTAETNPLLFVVDLFYDILIPVVLIGFIILIATDIFRRIRVRFQRTGA